MVNAVDVVSRSKAGEETAKILIEIKAVNFRPSQPYTLTAGWASPVYIDCRKLIAHLAERSHCQAVNRSSAFTAGKHV